MQGKPLKQKKILTDTFSITIDEQRYRAYEAAAKAEGMGLNQVKIQIINESGTQMEVTKTSQTSDVEGMVIQAWISGISKNRYA